MKEGFSIVKYGLYCFRKSWYCSPETEPHFGLETVDAQIAGIEKLAILAIPAI